jgi:tRNA(Ile)-lysidine synthase
LRGEESDRDSQFVKDFCKKKNIDCEIIDVDVLKHKAEQKKTLEQSARDLRFDALLSQMKKDNLNKLFLAHHKNDQAETILMHILRGAGISGACGIKEQSENIFRPFLKLSKQEIVKIAKEHGISFVVDSTNSDNDYTRNFVRNVIIPDMEKVYPNAVDAIFEFGNKCREVQEYIESSLKTELLEFGKDFCIIKDEAFENPKFIVREYVKKAFASIGVFSDIEAKHYDLVASLASGTVNSYLDLPHKVQAMRTYLGVKIFKKTQNKKTESCFEFALGETEIEGFGKIVAEIVSPESVVYGNGALYADFNKISVGAVWRSRKQGDIFAKLGTGSKKLNDYFTDKKIDLDKRDNVPVLAFHNNVLVVANKDVSENVKIDGNTDTIVKFTFACKSNS